MPTPVPTSSPSVGCDEGTSIYRLRMYDTGGDGWQGAMYTVRNSSSLVVAGEGVNVASGTLSTGSEGFEWLCLADGCYELNITVGLANDEIGFEFVDEIGGHFQDLGAPFHDHFCVGAGDVFDHPTASPTISLPPTSVPTGSPTPFPSYAPSQSPYPAPTPFPAPAPTQMPTQMPT